MYDVQVFQNTRMVAKGGIVGICLVVDGLYGCVCDGCKLECTFDCDVKLDGVKRIYVLSVGDSPRVTIVTICHEQNQGQAKLTKTA